MADLPFVRVQGGAYACSTVLSCEHEWSSKRSLPLLLLLAHRRLLLLRLQFIHLWVHQQQQKGPCLGHRWLSWPMLLPAGGKSGNRKGAARALCQNTRKSSHSAAARTTIAMSTSSTAAEQKWDPETYIKNAEYVPRLGQPVLELLSPQPSERILDLGCGDGALSVLLAARCAQLVAIDSSPEQVAAARARGLDAHVMDGHDLLDSTVGELSPPFDAVFSNAALHWMSHDPDAVLRGVAGRTRSGGRFVGEMGGEGNLGGIRCEGDSTCGWSKLKAAGFEVRSISLFPRPTPTPGGPLGLRSWLAIFAAWFIAALRVQSDGEGVVEEAVGEVEERVRGEMWDGEKGEWRVKYVRLRFEAVKRGGEGGAGEE
eukprot:jgi/Chlat1/9100/Chrsp97S08375